MDSNFRIRKVAKDDLPLIFQMEEEAFKPKHYPLFVLRQLFDIAPELFLVAVDELNDIKGYCFGGINQEEGIGWIFALAVTKQEQKKRIGERLTLELLNSFRNKNINFIQLTTTTDNDPAIRLYEKVGFRTVTETTDYYFDNSPRVIMKLEIA